MKINEGLRFYDWRAGLDQSSSVGAFRVIKPPTPPTSHPPPLPPAPCPLPLCPFVTLRRAAHPATQPRALPVKLSPCRPAKRASTLGNLLYLEPGIPPRCPSHPGIVMKIHRLRNSDPGPLGPRLHAPDPLLHRGLGALSRLHQIGFFTVEKQDGNQEQQWSIGECVTRVSSAKITPEDGGILSRSAHLTRHQSTLERDAPGEKHGWSLRVSIK